MLCVHGRVQQPGEGMLRRDFLHAGTLGYLGLLLLTILRAGESAATSAARTFGKARRCLLLFLTGGPPQLDTWDLKPGAPERIRGELRPIATNVVGMQISVMIGPGILSSPT